jgi:hypothetical protein
MVNDENAPKVTKAKTEKSSNSKSRERMRKFARIIIRTPSKMDHTERRARSIEVNRLAVLLFMSSLAHRASLICQFFDTRAAS